MLALPRGAYQCITIVVIYYIVFIHFLSSIIRYYYHTNTTRIATTTATTNITTTNITITNTAANTTTFISATTTTFTTATTTTTAIAITITIYIYIYTYTYILLVNFKGGEGSIVSEKYNIYEHQYAYITTSAFLHGYKPAFTILGLLTVPLLIAGLLIHHSQYELIETNRPSLHKFSSSRLATGEYDLPRLIQYLIYASRLFIEIFVQLVNLGIKITTTNVYN